MPGQPGRLPPQICARGALEAKFTDLLGRLKFDDEVLEWVREAVHASHADEKREHEEAIKRLRTEYDRLQNRINAIYVTVAWMPPSSSVCQPHGAPSKSVASGSLTATNPLSSPT